MKKFLEKVADYIIDEVAEHSLETVLVFPNRRSEIFLKKYLKQKTTKSLWLPEMFTIDEFIINASGLTELDPIVIGFKLYEIHKQITGVKARTIDDFLSWAPIMLTDFNDIDLYLANPEKIFNHLSEARAMQEWNLDGSPLTELQQNYLSFYHSLFEYYSRLNETLKKEQTGYKGMIYRNVANNIEQVVTGLPWKRFILVGFNALSKAERKIFGHLVNDYDTEVFWDVDEYYFSDKNKQSEAGRFIKQLIDEWGIKDAKWVSNDLLSDKDKTIDVVGVPKRIGQLKFAGQELEKLIERILKNSNPQKENEVLLDTAVVLADENLLTPMLNSLPVVERRDGSSVGYNITMGYPISGSPFNHLINQWLDLLILQNQNRNNKCSVYYLLGLLNNPIIQLVINHLTNNQAHKIIQQLTSRNNVFLSLDEIKDILTDNEKAVSQLFELTILNPKTPEAFINAFISLLQHLKTIVARSDEKNIFLKEQVVLLLTTIKKLDLFLAESKTGLSLKALQKIFNQLISRIEINLKGEPLDGIQIMGMLETRNLDFKNIILLSANEGVLPKTSSLESFIPFDIRSVYQLPLPKDKTDVYAYHFYRLLQRAQNVLLVYNSEPDQLGGGEKSRFILQLESELGKVNEAMKPIETTLHVPLPDMTMNLEIIVSKSDEVLELVKKKFKSGLSPTALSNYISCPLKFYFRNILDLYTPDTIDESIESNVFGSVVHSVLEKIYQPFINKTINPKQLGGILPDITRLVIKGFEHEYSGGDLYSGKNLLIVEVAKKYVQQFVKADTAELRKRGRKLIFTEEKLTTTIDIDGHAVLLKGIIDRVDKDEVAGGIRIIDYKTGDVKPGDLKIKDWDKLTTDSKWAKAFQVLFYSFLYSRNYQDVNNMEAGIISLRKISQGFMKVSIPDEEELSNGFDIFIEQLENIVAELTDQSVPFLQTKDEKECSWCDYKGICNKQGKSYF